MEQLLEDASDDSETSDESEEEDELLLRPARISSNINEQAERAARIEQRRQQSLSRSFVPQPVGVPIATTGSLASSSARQLVPRPTLGGTGNLTPTERLRETERGALFGFDQPQPSFAQLLNDIGSENPPPNPIAPVATVVIQAPPSPIATPPPPAQNSSDSLPTQDELWRIVAHTPRPVHESGTFAEFVTQLSSSSPHSNLTSQDMNSLLAELTTRDPTIPIRVQNAVNRRRIRDQTSSMLEGLGNGSMNEEEGQRQIGVLTRMVLGDGLALARQDTEEIRQMGENLRRANPELLRESEAGRGRRTGEGESPLMEGIWRAGFVEHVGEGGGGSDDEDPPRRRPNRVSTSETGSSTRTTFSEFARRRRALTREREEEGSGASTPVVLGSALARELDSTSASTPATSHPASPSSSSCPAPARPLTSADRAIAALRQQRVILPLPQESSSSPATLVESMLAESRARLDTPEGRRNRERIQAFVRSRIAIGQAMQEAEQEANQAPPAS